MIYQSSRIFTTLVFSALLMAVGCDSDDLQHESEGAVNEKHQSTPDGAVNGYVVTNYSGYGVLGGLEVSFSGAYEYEPNYIQFSSYTIPELGESSCGNISYTLNTNGRVIETWGYCTRVWFNIFTVEDGRIIETQSKIFHHTDDGILTSIEKAGTESQFTNNSTGQILTSVHTVRSERGEIIRKVNYEHEYNDKGYRARTTRILFTDYSGEPSSLVTTVTEFEYDSNGNNIKESVFDSAGNIVGESIYEYAPSENAVVNLRSRELIYFNL